MSKADKFLELEALTVREENALKVFRSIRHPEHTSWSLVFLPSLLPLFLSRSLVHLNDMQWPSNGRFLKLCMWPPEGPQLASLPAQGVTRVLCASRVHFILQQGKTRHLFSPAL